MNIHPAFELCELLVETICLHVVFDALQGFVFLLDFSHDGLSVDFELGSSLVMAAVSLHFGICDGVFEAMCHFSQGVVGSSPSLEEFNEPLW